MPITWNSEAEARLLLGILDQFKGTSLRINYDALAAYMGPGCSVHGVRQHIQKLRRDVCSSSGGSTSAPSIPARTPQKSKRAPSPHTPIKRAKGNIRREQDVNDDDEKECKGELIQIKNEDEKKTDLHFVDIVE